MARSRPAPPSRYLRSTTWQGLSEGDLVAVNVERETRSNYSFVAHVTNPETGDEWIELCGGKAGESRIRSFRPDTVYLRSARKGSRFVGLPLAQAPCLPFGAA
ncbi:MAG: hypothetical protein KJS64_04715 [Acidobacteria bacterium]|nr:hypothetical protein [Acidobacteriota bacterium]